MPAELKLTPWFDWPVKPTIKGLYDVRYVIRGLGSTAIAYNDIGRCYWNGREFFTPLGFIPLLSDGDQWRGLAERPE